MMSTTLLTPATLAQTIPQHHAQQASVLDVFVSSSTASTASTATSGYGGESTSSSKSSSQSRLEEVGNGSGGAFGPPYNSSQQASPATTPHALSTLGDEEDLAAQTRDRSNTWPLRRPNLDINAQTSPLIHEQIPEEDNDMFGSEEHLTPGLTEPMMAGTPEGPHHDFDIASPLVGTQPPPSATPDTADGAGNASKKSTTRRNAWGNMSYADLITQAIMSSPEKKLTLSQVYEWMVQNVPYFRDKGDSNSSAGWKNSIRHNLSLHNRFMRIQNEGAGKSSWWVINPDAKPGRNPRRPRAATMDNTTKVSMEKKRRGAKKRVDMPGNIRGPGLSANSLVGSQASILSHGDVYDDEPMSSFDTFRPRTQSTISIPATTSRVSPSMDSGTFDEFDFPPWVDQAQQAQAQQAVQAAAAAAAAPHCVNELLDRTCQIRIGDNGVPDASSFSRMLNGSHLNGIKTSPTQIKQETLSNGGIKLQNEINGVHPPPSYHELNSVRANSQLQQNPLLRNQLQSHLLGAKLSAPPPVVGFPCFSTPMYTAIAAGCPSTMLQWPGPSTTATLVSQPISCGQSAGLPTDLENLNLPDHSLMDLDMESLLRHELELSQNEKLGFD